MTTTETVLERPAEAVTEAAAPAKSRITSLAIGLWVVVGSLLGYGILQTAIKASALFG
jgi:hypothetical protein